MDDSFKNQAGGVTIELSGVEGRQEFITADIAVRATGLRNRPSTDVAPVRDSLGTRVAGQRFGNKGYYVGPSSVSGVNSNAGVGENTAAIWAYVPAATVVGYDVAGSARQR